MEERVFATSTDRRKAENLTREGFRTGVFRRTEADEWIGSVVESCDAVIVSAPPDAVGDPVLRAFEVRLRNAQRVSRLIYLSSLGVYGDHAGAWIDETTAARPADGRGSDRLDAERAWAAFGAGAEKHVFVLRLGGIYGPGRNALGSVANGTARRIVKQGQVFNRIHVEDVARAIDACLESSRPGGVWNVVDDYPASSADVVSCAARLLDCPEPPETPFESAALTEVARSFYSECKRATNWRLKQELGVRLAFPTYVDGLTALRNDPSTW